MLSTPRNAAFLSLLILVFTWNWAQAADFDTEFNSGLEALRKEQWKGAAVALENAVAEQPRHVEALFYLSQAYFMQGATEKAVKRILECVRLSPGHPVICQKAGQYLTQAGEHKAGLEWFLRAQELDDDLPGITFEIGMAYYFMAEWSSAEMWLAKAGKKEAANSEIDYYLADLAARRLDWTTARFHYEKAAACRPDDPNVFYGLGRALLNAGLFEESLGPLEKALALRPELAEAHFQLSKAYGKLGRTEDARKKLLVFQSIRERKLNKSVFSRQQEEVDRRIWDRSRELIQKGVEVEALALLSPGEGDAQQNPTALFRLGALYFSMGNSREAERCLLQALQLNPAEPGVLTYLGLNALLRKELEPAEKYLQTELKRDPDNQLAQAGMGQLRYLQKRWREAIDYYEQSRTTDPAMLLMLCEAYLRTQSIDRALLAADLVESFSMRDPQILANLRTLLEAFKINSQAGQ